jgi:hypothetical protein
MTNRAVATTGRRLGEPNHEGVVFIHVSLGIDPYRSSQYAVASSI